MKRIVTLFPMALLAGCATLFGEGSSSVHTLELGQPGNYGPVRLTPINIDEDSRCPVGTQCIWAGQVRVKVLVEPAGANHSVFAVLGKPLAVDGGTLLVEQVTPTRRSTRQIPITHYHITMRYTPPA